MLTSPAASLAPNSVIASRPITCSWTRTALPRSTVRLSLVSMYEKPKRGPISVLSCRTMSNSLSLRLTKSARTPRLSVRRLFGRHESWT